jgi:hypothetical protein
LDPLNFSSFKIRVNDLTWLTYEEFLIIFKKYSKIKSMFNLAK